ncbi:MAG: hypothetical protein JWM98_3431 [Thermoleophilia bacterium]|nr:hypothetical protein [Thermoleophilia bacterium]
MTKSKLPLIAVALVVVGAVLYMTVLHKPSGPTKKHMLEPITLSEPFVVNLSDTDDERLVSMNVAVQLEPMDDAHFAAFEGEKGHGGGAGPTPGELKVSTYPKFRDAVITELTSTSYSTLHTLPGQKAFKTALLGRFDEIAEVDAAELKSSAEGSDPTHLGPPYHVVDVTFTKLALQ